MESNSRNQATFTTGIDRPPNSQIAGELIPILPFPRCWLQAAAFGCTTDAATLISNTLTTTTSATPVETG